MKLLTTLIIAAVASPSFADTLIVTANSSSWSPSVANVIPGDILRFEYGSGYPHTITSGSGCMPDGIWFNEPLTTTGDFYEFTVPDDGTTEIPFYCAPHCNSGMTGTIVIDQLQGHLGIGLVDIVNAAPVIFSSTLVSETIEIEGLSVLQSSFLIGVEVEENDVDIDWTASSTDSSVQLIEVATNTPTYLDGSGTVTLVAGNKYAFIGKAIFGDFSFSIEVPTDGAEAGNFTAFLMQGNGSVVANGDSFMFRTAFSDIGEVGEMTFLGEGELLMTVAGNVTSATLALPPLGEEAMVTIPSGLHTVSFEEFSLLTFNIGGGADDGGGLPEDIDGDGVVGVNDLLAVIAAWGSTSP
jgi:plastocyanin